VIIVASLAQIAVGVACWCIDPDPETGRFGLAVARGGLENQMFDLVFPANSG
jgi:hypothetical protein